MKKRFFVVTAVIISSQLQAQKDTTSLDEVVLTANKFEQKQSQTGKVVTVITKEQLEKSSGKTLGQLLNEQVGLTIAGANNAPGSVQTVFMRGASSGRTLILLDGIPMNDPSMINNEFDLNLLSIYDIERIEISRGAQSTLYGSDAIAGVINIITIKKDVDKSFNGKATSVFGNRNTALNSVQLFGKVNKLAYTTRYSKLTTDGFSSAHDQGGNGNFDKDGYSGNLASTNLQYQVSPVFSLKGFIQYSKYKADVDGGIFNDDRDFTINNSGLSTGGGFNLKKGIFSITGNYQYGKIKRRYLNDSLDISGFAKFEHNKYEGISHFAELYGNIKATDWLTILVGADHRKSTFNQDYLSISNSLPSQPPPPPYEAHFSDSVIKQTSGYASLLFNALNKRLNVEIGVRFNDNSRYGNNSTYTFNPSFSISDNFRVFGSIASGYKAPSIYQVFDAFSGNQDLKAEESTNFEFGVQQTHPKISSRAVFFHRNIKDGIDFDYNSYTYFNFVKQEVEGLELELSLKPVRAFRLTANYTLITGEEKTQSRKTFADTSYNHLLRRPKHSFNISAGYQVCPEFYLSVSGRSASKRYDVGGYMSDDVEVDGYFVLNAYAEYKYSKSVKFFADLQNITDKKFIDIRGYNAIPFLISGGLTFNW
ncbi:MAG TPA: TonB-dependent receptor [Chitinophagaceae bacterium]